MAAVELQGVRKRFGEVEAVHRIDLEVRDGEFLVLVGPSGCGKSTILRMIAGLEEVSEGRIVIGGRDMTRVSPRDRDIAMVFQSYALYPHMTVRENLAFGLRVRKSPPEATAERVADVARTLALEQLLDRLPGQLSGGQRQRVAMGRAMVRRPKAFLFDEPLSNLDAALRSQMRVELRRLHNDLGTTTIYVTHDQVEAMTLADRIALLDKGALQQIGTPDELYDGPANTFVAGFIGSPTMNLFDGTTFGEPGAAAVRGPGFLVPLLPGRWNPPPASGTRVRLGARPNDLHIAVDKSEDAPGFRAVVDVIEPLGWEVHVHARGECGAITARVDRAALPAGLGPGAPVLLVPDPARVHLFDAGGTRLPP